VAFMILIIKHIGIEGPGLIADFFNNSRWKVQAVDLSCGDSLPSGLNDLEAVVVLGGPMNVYQESSYPFLKQENKFLRCVLDQEIPLLGICLGSQLMAKAKEAGVVKAPKPEIGWYKVLLTDMGMKDPLFEGLGPSLRVFQWHQDMFKVPKEALLLACSDVCAQAIRLGKNAYGLQFHIEITPEMIQAWLDYYNPDGELLNSEVIKNMVLDGYREKDYFFNQAQKLLLNFSRIIEAKQRQLA